jgi:hypothetical protein
VIEGHCPECPITGHRPAGERQFDLPSEFAKKRKQIATQPVTIAARDPGGACPILRLDDGIRRRDHL